MNSRVTHVPPEGQGHPLAGPSSGRVAVTSSAPPPAPKQTLGQRARRRLRYNLQNSVADGAAYSVMVGMGETYFPAFALALGLGEVVSGLVASVPLLLGSVLQLVSPRAVAWLGSYRRWCVVCVLMQAIAFLPLIIGACLGRLPTWGLFASIALYWAGGLGAAPVWNVWMETVVPHRVRAPFFAMRTRMGQAGVLVGFVLGGFALQFGKQTERLLPLFATLFVVSFACRVLSARFLARQTDAATVDSRQVVVPMATLLGRLRRGSSESLLLYFLAVQLAVQISGPYFAPFMLGQMRISYVHYVGLLAVSFLAKILALPGCGRLAAVYGARRLLWIGGIGIMPVAGLWLYVESFWALAIVQFAGGITWAAYELAVFLLSFETIRREERTSILTLFNLANSLALVFGAITGGVILKTLGESREAYLFLFGLSSLVRGAALLVLWMLPRKTLVLADEETSMVPTRHVVDQPVPLSGPVRSLPTSIRSGRRSQS
ncbi:MAG: MFS transporter [Planctomycetaceae bacterium]|jgi:MFS family permease